MTRKSRKTRIRLELTDCQKEQIRKATGREVKALELGLQGLPEPAVPPAVREDPLSVAQRATMNITRTRRGKSENGG